MLWRRMGEPVGPLTTDQKLDRLADVVGGLARQQQQQLQATRYTGLLASLKQVEWAAPELRCFAARLLVLATLAEGDDPAAAFALVKALIGIFQAEIATINDRLVRDGKVPWAEVERELNQILKRAAPDAVDTVMQLVHMTADEAKGSAETKRKRGREDDDMEERCTWHPNAKDRHTNSECKAQKSAASANAKALSLGLPSGLAQHIVAHPTAFVYQQPGVVAAAPVVTAQPVAQAPMPAAAPFPQFGRFGGPPAPCPTCGRRHSPSAVCWGRWPQQAVAPVPAAGPAAPAPCKPSDVGFVAFPWSLPLFVPCAVGSGVGLSGFVCPEPTLLSPALSNGLCVSLVASAETALLLPPSVSQTSSADCDSRVALRDGHVASGVGVESATSEMKCFERDAPKTKFEGKLSETRDVERDHSWWARELESARVGCAEDGVLDVTAETVPMLGSAIPAAQFRLSEAERAAKQFGRKLFDGAGLMCSFCNKRGHLCDFCPFRPNEPPPHRRIRFVEVLMQMPQVDVLVFDGKSLAEARVLLESMGTKLNQHNPWTHANAKSKRLKRALGFWKALGANKTVLSWLGYGVPLRFAIQPDRVALPNNTSCFVNAKWLQSEVDKNVAAGFYVEGKSEQVRVISPMQVEPKGQNDHRLCVDCRWLNFYLPTPEVRFETPGKNGVDVIVQGNAQFTTDLEKAYYAVGMDEEAVPYLGMAHAGRVLMALVLPFGLNIAPATFHKIMRELVRFLRVLKINVLNYLDDFLWSERWERVKELISFVRWLLPLLGWICNDKSVWEPAFVVTFFGLIVDAQRYEFRVQPDRVKRVKRVLSMMKERADAGQALLVDDLRSLTGTLSSFRLAVEPVGAWTRALYIEIERAKREFAQQMVLSPEARDEIDFWLVNLERCNGRPIAHPLAHETINVDASEFGWGAVFRGESRFGFLSDRVIGTSSTRRELIGLRLAAESLAEHLKGKKVMVEMDSFAAVCNLTNGGGPVPDLCKEVKLWWKWCDENKVTPQYSWIPRERNREADKLSKANGRRWVVRESVKKAVLQRWHVTEAGWRTPEFGAVGATIRDAQQKRLRIALVYPGWPGQSWWLEVGRYSQSVLPLGKVDDVFEPVSQSQRIGSGQPDWVFFCALLDFAKFR